MTHVIYKMRQLSLVWMILMVLSRERLKFSSDTVNLLEEKSQLDSEMFQNVFIINPAQMVIVCFTP